MKDFIRYPSDGTCVYFTKMDGEFVGHVKFTIIVFVLFLSATNSCHLIFLKILAVAATLFTL